MDTPNISIIEMEVFMGEKKGDEMTNKNVVVYSQTG